MTLDKIILSDACESAHKHKQLLPLSQKNGVPAGMGLFCLRPFSKLLSCRARETTREAACMQQSGSALAGQRWSSRPWRMPRHISGKFYRTGGCKRNTRWPATSYPDVSRSRYPRVMALVRHGPAYSREKCGSHSRVSSEINTPSFTNSHISSLRRMYRNTVESFAGHTSI